jgi:aryl-alcohol dehydrogenase-like predicted oxidoreductase
MPRPATIQNSFSLLNREFEDTLAETCAPSNCNVGLLPWSILCGGVLTGKYSGLVDADNKLLADPSIATSRFGLEAFKNFQPRYRSRKAIAVVDEYAAVAKEAGVSIAALAHAFCKSRWYIPSTIIGATTVAQLKENVCLLQPQGSGCIWRKCRPIANLCKLLCLRVCTRSMRLTLS